MRARKSRPSEARRTSERGWRPCWGTHRRDSSMGGYLHCWICAWVETAGYLVIYCRLAIVVSVHHCFDALFGWLSLLALRRFRVEVSVHV